jgi:transmembrane sensor
MTASINREVNVIRETATEWVVHLSSEDVTAQERAAFTGWLRRSPAHVAEYLQAEAAWQAMQGAAREDDTAIQEIAGERCPEVMDFPGSGLAVRKRATQRPRLPLMKWAVAAVVPLTLAFVFGPSIVDRFDPNLYSTGVGESRRVMLADGSEVELNTRSRVRIRMRADAREVLIKQGEAFFRVAKDPTRPFRVLSDTAVVRALGTEFNVYRQPGQTTVTVIEGRIAVMASNAADTAALPAELTIGQRVVIPGSGEVSLSTIDPVRAIAWRERRLIFENDTLSAAVEEFNRYNARQLAIGSPELAAKRISGVFKADRPDALVDFLTKTSDVRAVDKPRSTTLLVTGR